MTFDSCGLKRCPVVAAGDKALHQGDFSMVLLPSFLNFDILALFGLESSLEFASTKSLIGLGKLVFLPLGTPSVVELDVPSRNDLAVDEVVALIQP